MSSGGARPRHATQNRNRTCQCGKCTLCKIRSWKHDYYLSRREETKARTAANYRKQKQERQAKPEPDEAELDRRALEWLENRGLR